MALDVLADVASTPVHQHITFATADEARACPRGAMSLTFCRDCAFVFNAAFDPALVRYSPQYDNAQEHSPAFQRYLDTLVGDLVARHALVGKTIVEIGCGQGKFLAQVSEAGAAAGVGFDPSADSARVASSPRLRLVPAEYDAAHPLGFGEIICARHVVEHLPAPAQLIAAIAAVARGRACTLWLETPRVEWILERRAFWDVFYEHCSYFAMPVLASLVRAHGFRVTRHDATFGTQYQWLEADLGVAEHEAKGAVAADDEASLERLHASADDFRRDWRKRSDVWRGRTEGLARRGPCVMWGAGAKGTTALNALDPDATAIAAAVDLNPRKQGRYVPGTGHAIVAPAQLRTLRPRSVLVVNENYRQEIGHALRDLDLHVEVLTLDHADEAPSL